MDGTAAGAFVDLVPGDPLPRFFQQGGREHRFAWDAMAGRYLLFCAFLIAADPLGRSALAAINREAGRFDDVRATAIAVGVEPSEAALAALGEHGPGVNLLWDRDFLVCRVLGVAPKDGPSEGQVRTRPSWVLVDPSLHVLAVAPFDTTDPEHKAIFRLMDGLEPPERFGGIVMPAPVLVLPNVFTPELRQALIGLHAGSGGAASHIIVDDVAVVDGAVKRRSDVALNDPALLRRIGDRFARCVTPEVRKLFFMQLNHLDRPIISCYGAEDAGHYLPHRDNNAGATAHRRFAVSVNLNDDFEGGEVYFPEYGGAKIKAPAGWAVVFPCGVLHGVAPVTKGRRYAFLPFMFDDEGARIKAANAVAKG